MEPVLDYSPPDKPILWRNLPLFMWRMLLKIAPLPLLLVLFFNTTDRMHSVKVHDASGEEFWSSLLPWHYSHVRMVSDEGDTFVCMVSGVDSHSFMRVRKAGLDSRAQDVIHEYLDTLQMNIESDIEEGRTVDPEWRERLAILAGQDFGESSLLWHDWISGTGLKASFPAAILQALRDARVEPASASALAEYDLKYRYYWRHHWQHALLLVLCVVGAVAWIFIQKYIKLPPLRTA